ncbi:PAS domain S-box protein [Methanospirillum lacunae]|uniref:PAS domain S-box protein n=1 Tax=Methanospirillum lacunae TaxID=668570 RepID=UPI0026C96B8D
MDDEEELLNLGKIFLEQTGVFRVDVLTSASDALKFPSLSDYDAIISDYQMPEIDGISFLQQVRKIHGDIPFILFTGRGREEIVIEAINNGADYYIQKGGDATSQFAELGYKIKTAVGRRQTELKLRESEKKFSDIIEFLPDATFAIDQSGLVIAWNKAIEELTGVSSEIVMGKGKETYRAVFYSTDRPILIDLIDEPEEHIRKYYSIIHREEGSITAEADTTQLNGKGISILTKVSRLYDQSGRVSGAIETIRDITLVKQSDHELKRSEARYHSIVDDQIEMIFRVVPDGTITFMNEAFRQFTSNLSGFAPTEGDNIRDFLRDTYALFEKSLFPLNEKKPVREIDQEIIHNDGRKSWKLWSVKALFDRNNGLYEYQVVGRDITDTKKAEEAHRESEEKFHRFADNARDILYRMTLPDRRFDFISRAATTLTGYTPEDFYADPNLLKTLIHPDSVDAFNKRWVEILENRSPLNFDFKIINRYGRHRWFNLRNSIITGKNGELVALEGIVTDVSEQKEIENRLRRSEERFIAVTQNAGSWVWELDQDGVYTYASPAVYSILGYWPDELIGKKHFYDLFDPTVRDELKNITMSAISTFQVFNDLVNCNRHKDGRQIFLKTNGMPVFDQKGVFTGYCGVDLDITTEREVEQRLVESEAKFRLLAENISDVICVVDFDRRFTYISPSVQLLMEFTPDELLHKKVEEVLAQDTIKKLEPVHKKWITAISVGEATPDNDIIEIELKHKDGSTIWADMKITTIKDQNKKVTGFLAVIRDNTEHRLAEKALIESEEKFRSLVENANDVVFSITPDGVFTYISPKWSELLGYDESEGIGKRMFAFIHPDDISHMQEFVSEAISKGRRMSGNIYRIRHKNGTWQWHSQSISPVFNDEGIVLSLQGICHDITRLKQNKVVLERANRQLSLLTGITRHDILNKITVILGCVSVAQLDCKNEEINWILNKIRSATNDIKNQIEFTRIYEGLGAQEPQWVELETVIPTTTIPCEITMNSDLKKISILADQMVKRVFYNLLDNSVRHGLKVNTITVSTNEDKGELFVLWEDNGIGIPFEEKEKIFERGFGKNTGLGMFLAREILSLTGISIQETGEPGKGARFVIRVPGGVFRTRT